MANVLEELTVEIAAPAVTIAGIGGLQRRRMVGRLPVPGPPAGGAADDEVVDSNGVLWVCTAPGVWTGGTFSSKIVAKAGVNITGDDGTTVNGYRSLEFVLPPAGDDRVGGITIKAPSPTWGYNVVNYGEGQAIVVLNDADSAPIAAPVPLLSVITAVSNTTPVQITAANHGFSTGDNVRINGTGIAALDGGASNPWQKWWKITKVDNNNFTLNLSVLSGAAATGWCYSDRSAVALRVVDGLLGVTGGLHVAVALRGRSGFSSNGAIGIDVDPTTDAIGIILRNALTTEWGPTPTLDYLQVQDLRSAPGRTLLKVEADGTVTMRPQSGKAAAGVLMRTRNDADSANAFELRNSGGFLATGPSAIGPLGIVATEAFTIQSITNAGGALALFGSNGQSVDLFPMFNYLGQTVTRFDKDGRLFFKHSTAPLLADMADGEFTLWYDATLPGGKVTRRTAGALVTTVL